MVRLDLGKEKMRNCLVSLDIPTIKRGLDDLVLHSVAMNPSIPKREFMQGTTSFFEHIREIRQLIGYDMPFYIQLVGENCDKMVSDAIRIRKEIGGELIIKVPVSNEGFKTISVLKTRGFKISCTAVMSLNQALLAAESGADVIAVYTSRLDELGVSSVRLLQQIQRIYLKHDCSTDICAASIKNPLMIEKFGVLGIDFIAADLPVLQKTAISL